MNRRLNENYVHVLRNFQFPFLPQPFPSAFAYPVILLADDITQFFSIFFFILCQKCLTILTNRYIQRILDCHQLHFVAISSNAAKLLIKSIMLFQTNFLQLVKCDKEAFWDCCSLVFYTELPSIPHHTQCYVEDTNLISNFNLQDQANAIAKLKEDLCRISNWTFRNQLLINSLGERQFWKK